MARLTKREIERGIDLGSANPLQWFERLQPALGLSRLGRLCPEAIDKELHVSDGALLTLECRLLLRQCVGTLALEVGIVTFEQPQRAVFQVANILDRLIKQ